MTIINFTAQANFTKNEIKNFLVQGLQSKQIPFFCQQNPAPSLPNISYHNQGP